MLGDDACKHRHALAACRRVSLEIRTRLVFDVNEIPSANPSGDSLYPNDTAYAFIAKVSYGAVQKRLRR